MQVIGPSRTAQRVAAHRLSYTRPASPSGNPGADDALAHDVAAGVVVDDGGMHRYLEARTAFFDTAVLDALATGIDQVVVLGAGYDGRALRFGSASARWFEVDLAATQGDKLARLARLAIDVHHVVFVAADFAHDDVGRLLVASGLDPSRAALFLLEGVAPYLDVDVLQALLTTVRAVAAPDSRFAMSLGVARDPGDRAAVRRAKKLQRAVAKLGEPIRSTIEPGEVEPILGRAGWRRVAAVAPPEPDGTSTTRLGLVLAEPAG